MALITSDEYKAFMGIDPTDTRQDAQITALLEGASRAVLVWTGRNFDIAAGASSRSYQYDGSGYLDIDDCTAITNVQINIPNVPPVVLDAAQWQAMPADGSPVFYYLILYGTGSYFGFSPEMGFERNLDQYPATAFKPATIQVDATWGWPDVPEDVKLATALTVENFIDAPETEGLASEAIEGWSRSWNRAGSTPKAAQAVPDRARDILATYQRIYV